MKHASTTPFGLLISGIALTVFASFMTVVNNQIAAFPSWWGWGLVSVGVAMVVTAFVWGNNLSDETKRRLMVMPRATRRMYWPFLKDLQFFPEDEFHEEVERLKTKSGIRIIPPANVAEIAAKQKAAKEGRKEEVFIPPLQE